MVSSKTAVAITVLINRVLVFILLFVSLMVLVTDKAPYFNVDGDEPTFPFKGIYAYRYLLSVAVIGCAYMLLQIPFAALSISKENNLTQISLLVIFADLVLALLFATGVGAGFGFTVDKKIPMDKWARRYGEQDDPYIKDTDKALDLVYVSTGFLLSATICMAATIIISMHALARKSFLI